MLVDAAGSSSISRGKKVVFRSTIWLEFIVANVVDFILL